MSKILMIHVNSHPLSQSFDGECIHCFFDLSGTIIGLTETSRTVPESVGRVSICAEVFGGTALEGNVFLRATPDDITTKRSKLTIQANKQTNKQQTNKQTKWELKALDD